MPGDTTVNSFGARTVSLKASGHEKTTIQLFYVLKLTEQN